MGSFAWLEEGAVPTVHSVIYVSANECGTYSSFTGSRFDFINDINYTTGQETTTTMTPRHNNILPIRPPPLQT